MHADRRAKAIGMFRRHSARPCRIEVLARLVAEIEAVADRHATVAAWPVPRLIDTFEGDDQIERALRELIAQLTSEQRDGGPKEERPAITRSIRPDRRYERRAPVERQRSRSGDRRPSFPALPYQRRPRSRTRSSDGTRAHSPDRRTGTSAHPSLR